MTGIVTRSLLNTGRIPLLDTHSIVRGSDSLVAPWLDDGSDQTARLGEAMATGCEGKAMRVSQFQVGMGVVRLTNVRA